MTGSLGAALGWHFMNNFLAMTIVGYNDTFNGFAWRLLSFGYADAPSYFFVLDTIVYLTTWLILRSLLKRSASTQFEPI